MLWRLSKLVVDLEELRWCEVSDSPALLVLEQLLVGLEDQAQRLPQIS